MSKGFPYPQAQEAIASLEIENDQEQEEDLIYRELDKQVRKYAKKYQGYDLQQRLIQSLARKGYDYDLIKTAIRDYM
jgi:regulatory protein